MIFVTEMYSEPLHISMMKCFFSQNAPFQMFAWFAQTSLRYQMQSHECFTLKNFANFVGKTVSFIIKLHIAGCRCATLCKRDSDTSVLFFPNIMLNLPEQIFTEQLQMTVCITELANEVVIPLGSLIQWIGSIFLKINICHPPDTQTYVCVRIRELHCVNLQMF